ncbi:MAG: hypothetical protein WA655_01855 [Candidatus Korobacteraceae bacterium]
MDKPRASVFVLTAEHQVPLSLSVDDTEVHRNANDYTAEFLDPLLPAVCEIATIDFVYPGPGDYTQGQATVVTVEKNPLSSWDVIEIGGCDNSLLNRAWLYDSTVDDYTFLCQPIAAGGDLVSDQTGTGGYLGCPQSRFAKRAAEIWHQPHAVARGQIGP